MRLPTDMEIRRALGKSLAPAMAITGYRFSKRHRQENTIIYRVFDTVGANLTADRLKYRKVLRTRPPADSRQGETAMRSIRFNTGRYYGPDHQPIHVRVTRSLLMFDDEARGILGEIRDFPPRLLDASTTELEIQTVVMAAYDNGLYRDGYQAVWEEMA